MVRGEIISHYNGEGQTKQMTIWVVVPGSSVSAWIIEINNGICHILHYREDPEFGGCVCTRFLSSGARVNIFNFNERRKSAQHQSRPAKSALQMI